MNEYDEKVARLEAAAQRAAEERIELAHATLDDERVEVDLVGPYCGCITCDVREVLAAAWPHLRDLALLESQHVELDPYDGPQLLS